MDPTPPMSTRTPARLVRPSLWRDRSSKTRASYFSTTNTIRSDDDEDPDEKWFGAVGPLLPLVLSQGPSHNLTEAMTEEQAQKEWLRESERASEYVNLLYDFAIGSILSVFASSHPIVDGNHILAYFSYFVIIWWVWASQVIYDGRFQADDWMHRAFRFVQLGSFTYIGVYAKDFDPTYVIRPADITTTAAVIEVGSSDAFNGTAIAYCVSRIFLALQYLYVMAMAGRHRKGRKTFFLVPAFVYLLSAGLWVTAGLLPQLSIAKLTFAYVGLLLEIVATVGTWYLPKAIEPSPVFLSKRFGDLSVVILAEGILDIVATLTTVIEGFGLAAGSSPISGTTECVCALVIVYGIWHFLFHAFHPKSRFRDSRSQGVWGLLHFPLHFAILLLLAGVQNVAVYSNVRGTFNALNQRFGSALDLIKNATVNEHQFLGNNKTLNFALLDDNTIYMMNKLGVQPTYIVEVDLLDALYNNLTEGNKNLTSDPQIDIYHYQGNIWWQVAQEYDFTLSNETNLAYSDLINGSTAYTGPNSSLLNDAVVKFDYFNSCYNQDMYTSSLFFLPCAGGVVLVAAILTVFRTKGITGGFKYTEAPETLGGMSGQDITATTTGVAEQEADKIESLLWIPLVVWGWVPFSLHVTVGLGLCFLGVLAKPIYSINSPMVTLLSTNWALPTAAISYGGLIILDCGISTIIRIARGEPWWGKAVREQLDAAGKASESGNVQRNPPTPSPANADGGAYYLLSPEIARLLREALASPPTGMPVSVSPVSLREGHSRTTATSLPSVMPALGPQAEIPTPDPSAMSIRLRSSGQSSSNSDPPLPYMPSDPNSASSV